VKRKRVLILCTGNSCRSQMAEGFVNQALGEAWEAQSAGTRPMQAVHPLMVKVMAEAGVDLSAAVPRSVEPLLDEPWDLVVTVCDRAQESCPAFPRAVPKVYLPFDDPAAAEGTEEERLTVFRQIRDEIRERLLPEVARRTE
jgi:arsenate reductase (thioredoxin)